MTDTIIPAFGISRVPTRSNGDGSYTPRIEAVGVSAVATATFTRPADTTAYTAGDLIANSTTAGSVVPLALPVARVAGGTGIIRAIRLKASGAGAAGATVRVHLYRQSPTVTNGDNGVWLTTESEYVGSVDVTLDRTFSDAVKGTVGPGSGADFVFATATESVHVLAETGVNADRASSRA